MTIDKEIRAVALKIFHPDEAELDKMLSNLDRIQPIVNVKYAESNPKDPTCMEIMLGLQTLGYVNKDDKRFVEPLLRSNTTCEAQFLEVYREEGHTPIVRFTVTVDLDEVEPLVAGEEWEKFVYSFNRLKMLEELSTVEYTGHLLKDWLQKKKECEYTTLDELVESFISASLFDMSVETSAVYDDMLFYLETGRNRNRKLINNLQRGSTIRRTDRARKKFLTEWWPNFMKGELVKRLCEEFVATLKGKNAELTDDVFMKEYHRLDQELRTLPYDLYTHIDDLNEFWGGLYYTLVPKSKFIDVLSGIVLRTKLKACIDKKVPFIVENQYSQYYQIFSGGENNVSNY